MALHEPPPNAIVVTDGRIGLRATAWAELHSWLASAARLDEDVGPELEPAKHAYRRSLEKDDDDALFARTAHALSRCTDDRCASTAVSGEGFGSAFGRALPRFVVHHWLERATDAFVGVEAAKAALDAIGPASDAIFVQTASDLHVRWPDHALPIDIVSVAPPPGRTALAPAVLGTRGACFARDRSREGGDRSIDQVRILDCVLVHALLAATREGSDAAGPVHESLVATLGERDGERAWALLVIHATAVTVTGIEPKHRSVYRRSADAAEGPMLAWLAREWHGARSTIEPSVFATRYAAAWRDARAASPASWRFDPADGDDRVERTGNVERRGREVLGICLDEESRAR